MTNTTTFAFLALTSLSLIACAGSPESEFEGEEDVATVQQEMEEDNGLAPNGLIANGLIANGLIANGLIANGLIANGLIANGLVMGALTDPNARLFFKYVASCALPAGQSITLTVDGVQYTYYGSMGLAPSWGITGGSCDESCRSWVSSCVLSRVNFLGVTVPLSIRGNKAQLASDLSERSAYSDREAAYYGDVFSVPQRRYACKSPGSNLISRSCGPDPALCAMKVVGDCSEVCDNVGPDGSYQNCHDDLGNLYSGPVTVFRLHP